MFSSGQWTFVIFFVITFIIVITISYRKDTLLHKKHYKGAYWVLIGFITFVMLLIFKFKGKAFCFTESFFYCLSKSFKNFLPVS